MAEIRKVKSNGLTVASTFSGCGGSCLGFRWAGFRHVYANEFVKAAQETYRANFPDVDLDTRDVRSVTPQDLLARSGLRRGDLDVFEGSPPCQAFSTAGKRHHGWGKDKDHGGGAKGGSEDLFFEYVRLLRGLEPRAFVAENVSGLVKGVAKGYFLDILADLKASRYEVECRILDAQWLGVPQARQRTIFIGIRKDLGFAPTFPAPLPYRYSIRDALPWIGGLKFMTGARTGKWNPYNKTFDVDVDVDVVNTIPKTADGLKRGEGWSVVDKTAPPLQFTTEWQAGETVDPDAPAPTLMKGGIGGSSYSQLAVNAPRPEDLPPSYRKMWLKLKPGEADPKRFSLVRTDETKPSPSITVSPGASITHPYEPRKFTIPELRRLGGFPDDFVLTGSFQDQWARVGNSVPPPMMRAVAVAVRDLLLSAPQSKSKKRK